VGPVERAGLVIADAVEGDRGADLDAEEGRREAEARQRCTVKP
jgi:hypothetical protein